MRALSTLLLLAAAATAGPDVLEHDLELTIDPTASRFESRDRVRIAGEGLPDTTAPAGVTVAVADAGEGRFDVSFQGVIRNPVKRSTAATWVAGDSTPGTIGPEGSYLVRGFYVPSAEPARFRVKVRVKLPHRAVTQGRRVSESEKDGWYEATFVGGAPADGLVVVTGPWTVREETIDGLACRTYLYEQDAAHAEILLNTLRAEVPRFQKVFGPVPDGRFDVVENFFASGYGFPNFTLLGDTVIRYVCARSKDVLPAGYLDHELVHCWLGNHLHVDYAAGNWCEALTTYFSNYGAAERAGTGAAYRRKVARGFSLKVTGKDDYPLRAFKAKAHDYENDIGYGKGSMVFHMLARELGAETFRAAVRHAVETRGGRKLGWDDLVAALSEKAGRDLDPWFEPWLDRTGAPVLKAGPLFRVAGGVGGTVVQAQDGPAYDLAVPVRIRTANGAREHVVRCRTKEAAFFLPLDGPVEGIDVDPDHHVFRKIPRADVAPCLEAVLTAPKRVGFGDGGLLARLGVDAVEPDLPPDAAVFAVGLPEALRVPVLAHARRHDPTVAIEAGRFVCAGATYDQPGDGLLFTCARADAPGLPVTFFHGNGKDAFARTRYLPYYASDSWVVFRGGRPVARGTFEADAGARAGLADTADPARTLVDLTAPARRGREAGTPEAFALANELRTRLRRLGLAPVATPPVALPDGRRTSNVVGVLGDPARPGVLLAAHWDGVGAAGPGAADNAAGVAVVLDVARRLREAELGRPVVVALFGGEEAGLVGSRAFAQALPVAKPVAAVNVDGIGSHKDGTVYLIGRSHYPELWRVFERAAAGLTVGKDIDKFAYPKGSDHWPLHREAGIPAVTVFSADYRALNTAKDTLDRIDVAAVRRIADAVHRMVLDLAR